MSATMLGDEDDEPEPTPEQRDWLEKIDFKFPQLNLPTNSITRIADDVARLSRLTLSEGMLKSLTGISTIIAERNAELFEQIKPILDLQSAWQRTLPVINSDIVKLTGLNQSYFSTISSQLAKSADFGWTGELAKIAKQYADQQAHWLKAVTPALPGLARSFFPSNLQGIEGLGLQDVDQVVMLDGIALYEVPRAEIAEKLVRAPISSARREILGRKWRPIAADSRAILGSCQSSETALIARFALDAVDALERGSVTSAQALVGSLIDTILRKYLATTMPLIVPSKKTKNSDAYLAFSVCKYIALGPIWQSYQSYYPGNGDRVPRTFNRHATAHTVGSQQYSRRNAIQGLMIVCGLLKFLDEQASMSLAV